MILIKCPNCGNSYLIPYCHHCLFGHPHYNTLNYLMKQMQHTCSRFFALADTPPITAEEKVLLDEIIKYMVPSNEEVSNE